MEKKLLLKYGVTANSFDCVITDKTYWYSNLRIHPRWAHTSVARACTAQCAADASSRIDGESWLAERDGDRLVCEQQCSLLTVDSHLSGVLIR